MAILKFEQQAVALHIAVLGKKPSFEKIGKAAGDLERETISPDSFVGKLFSTREGMVLFSNKTNEQILNQVYTNIYKKPADPNYIKSLVNSNDSIDALVVKITSDVLYYKGFDNEVLNSQQQFVTEINAANYPAASQVAQPAAADVQAFYYVLGLVQDAPGINYYSALIASGNKTKDQVAQSFVNSKASKEMYSDSQFVTLVYSNAYLREPSKVELNNYVEKLSSNTISRGDVLLDVIKVLRNNTVAATDEKAQAQFIKATHVYHEGELPAISFQEQVSALFLAILNRGVDASGLDTWSKQLAYGVTYKDLANRVINSPEFQVKGAQLNDDAFIQRVYKSVHGVDANDAQLAVYRALGKDKASITVAIINDLRNSSALDSSIVTQQHAFEANIGNSLLYKTSANLISSANNGNASGEINTGNNHVLSNAETAVLDNINLYTNYSTLVDLKYADNLEYLSINGIANANVVLSENIIGSGVNVKVNNGNVKLDASSADDVVTFTSISNLAEQRPVVNLGKGDDKLLWNGNAKSGKDNAIQNVQADGGDGVNTLSANLLSTSNKSSFSNFQKIDLGGFVGNDGVFDSKKLHANSVGSEGYVLSKKAGNVVVTNTLYSDEKAVLEITGDAGKDSHLTFNFKDNVTNKFDLNFNGIGDDSGSLIDAGTINLVDSVVSSRTLVYVNAGTALSEVNIHSYGTGNVSNKIVLPGGDGKSNHFSTINIDGDKKIDFNTSIKDNVFLSKIDASGNTAGVNITSDLTGPKAAEGKGGWLTFFGFNKVFDTIPVVSLVSKVADGITAVASDIVRGIFSFTWFKGGDVPNAATSFEIVGTKSNDTFSIKSGTKLDVGGGKDTIILNGEKNADFSTVVNFGNDDVIRDSQSGISITSSANLASRNETGYASVKDYGFRSANNFIDFAKSAGNVILGNVLAPLSSFKDVIGIKDGQMAKVGVSSNDSGSFVLIDNNGSKSLDDGDTILFLAGVSHSDAQNFVYNQLSTPTINGVSHAPEML
ncbi:protein of unknown function [Serratia sp. JKS296]|uniref:DUF4214 domain-containing protein n=1 Tax=Serratia sp. JKS296 TaxID=1938824 RepID=UPI000BD6670B|nr:DUF4214 domain-containing protein [Serratia sp. JKS296]SOD79444.1 protein of unknown function [Serratia sp. JKS296]